MRKRKRVSKRKRESEKEIPKILVRNIKSYLLLTFLIQFPKIWVEPVLRSKETTRHTHIQILPIFISGHFYNQLSST